MKLHGMPLSNYFCMVRQALLEKGLDFDIVELRPSQEPDFLLKSPMGKVPVLETTEGFLTETDAILDFLDEAFAPRTLFPQDAFARAKVRQLMKMQELYVETPVHNLVGALFGREVPEAVKEQSRPAARKGLAAVGRLARFDPWICGAQFTAADIFVFHSFTLGNRLTRLVYDWDMLQEVSGLAAWYQRMAQREATRLVLEPSLAAQEALLGRARG